MVQVLSGAQRQTDFSRCFILRLRAGLHRCAGGGRRANITTTELETLRDLASWAEGQLCNLELNETLGELWASQARIRAIIHSVAEGIIVLRPSGKIESMNGAAAHSFGVPASSVVDEVISRFILEPAPSKLLHDVKKRATTHGHSAAPMRFEVSARRHNGSLFPAEVSITVLSSRELFVMAFRDISERRKLEAMRDDVTQMVVHDLKSPLTAILAFFELARSRLEPQNEATADVEQIRRAAASMLELVTSLLDVSRLEVGMMPLHVQPTDLVALTREAAASLSSLS